MTLYNMMTCSGWEVAGGYVTGGSCMKARLGIVILFFIIAIVRRWGGEEMGMDFSFLFSLIGGLVSYIVIIIVTGNFKIALGVGLLLALLFGYGAGPFFGGEE